MIKIRHRIVWLLMWMGWGFLARTPVLEHEQWQGHRDTVSLAGWSMGNVPGGLWALCPPPPSTTKIKKRFDKECFWGRMLAPPVTVGITLESALYMAFQGWEVLCGEPSVPWEVLDLPAMEHPHLWSTHACGVSLGMREGCCPPILPSFQLFPVRTWGWNRSKPLWDLLAWRKVEHWICFNGRSLTGNNQALKFDAVGRGECKKKWE